MAPPAYSPHTFYNHKLHPDVAYDLARDHPPGANAHCARDGSPRLFDQEQLVRELHEAGRLVCAKPAEGRSLIAVEALSLLAYGGQARGQRRRPRCMRGMCDLDARPTQLPHSPPQPRARARDLMRDRPAPPARRCGAPPAKKAPCIRAKLRYPGTSTPRLAAPNLLLWCGIACGSGPFARDSIPLQSLANRQRASAPWSQGPGFVAALSMGAAWNADADGQGS